jgi:hypothetical protein
MPIRPIPSDSARRLATGAATVLVAALAGCATGPSSVTDTRLAYNEAIKATAEQQLLLNIVRLRYTDTPSSLSVASVTAQFELIKQLQLTPFFTASGAEPNRSFTAILPQAGVSYADRPTISLLPIDDAEFTRKLFTPLTLDGVLYLAKTTWPISTVFRLYLENINWVPNAEFASGPTPAAAPDYATFAEGVEALGRLQADGRIVFTTEERVEPAGDPLPAARVDAAAMLEAARNGYVFRADPGGATYTLGKRVRQPVLYIDPKAVDGPAARTFLRAFRLRPGQTRFDITVESLRPFAHDGADGVDRVDLETRSLLQAMYYVSHGVEIPPDHAGAGIARTTLDASGRPFDWQQVTRGVFRARWSRGEAAPPGAHVAVRYRDHWFYVPADDHDSKATFSLLMELSRLDVEGKPGDRPVLSLPVGR